MKNPAKQIRILLYLSKRAEAISLFFFASRFLFRFEFWPCATFGRNEVSFSACIRCVRSLVFHFFLFSSSLSSIAFIAFRSTLVSRRRPKGRPETTHAISHRCIGWMCSRLLVYTRMIGYLFFLLFFIVFVVCVGRCVCPNSSSAPAFTKCNV